MRLTHGDVHRCVALRMVTFTGACGLRMVKERHARHTPPWRCGLCTLGRCTYFSAHHPAPHSSSSAILQLLPVPLHLSCSLP